MILIPENKIISNDLTPAERETIRVTIGRLGEAVMTPSAHGYQADKNETVIEAAERSVKNHGYRVKISSAITIMEVILAANRNYNTQVVPHLKRMWNDYPGLTIKRLAAMAEQAGTAINFREVWGHNDEKKFQTLKSVLAAFLPRLENLDTPENDYRVVSDWAKNTQLSTRRQDDVGGLRNIGIATFQHLRMSFGVDTVKPDQRVKEVLEREFMLRLSDEKTISVVERLAETAGITTLLLDKILVKYGSGHPA